MTRFVKEEEFDEVTKEGFWIADFMTDAGHGNQRDYL